MVEAIVIELEALKAKVEETIAHVKAGVTTLNEEQVGKLHSLLQEVGMAAEEADQKVWHVVQAAYSAAQEAASAAAQKVEDDAKGAEADVRGAGVAVVEKVETGSESLLHKVEGVFEAIKDKAEEMLGIEPKHEETPSDAA